MGDEARAKGLLPAAGRLLAPTGHSHALRVGETAQGLLRAHRSSPSHTLAYRMELPRQLDIDRKRRLHQHCTHVDMLLGTGPCPGPRLLYP